MCISDHGIYDPVNVGMQLGPHSVIKNSLERSPKTRNVLSSPFNIEYVPKDGVPCIFQPFMQYIRAFPNTKRKM